MKIQVSMTHIFQHLFSKLCSAKHCSAKLCSARFWRANKPLLRIVFKVVMFLLSCVSIFAIAFVYYRSSFGLPEGIEPLSFAKPRHTPAIGGKSDQHFSKPYITSLRYLNLPLQEALRVPFIPKVKRKYDIKKLSASARPFDPHYLRRRTDLDAYLYNFESHVGIDFREVDFERRNEMAIGLGQHEAVYFGLVHSHTADSDGKGTPAEAFAMGKEVAALDFMAVTDHPEYWLLRDPQVWENLQDSALKISDDTFVALPGFEYSNTGLGHYVVLGTPGWRSSFQDLGLHSFYDWLQKPSQADAVVFFAHPGYHRFRRQIDFARFAFEPAVRDKLVGIEVVHHNNSKPFLKGFDGKLPYLDTALQQGWWLGSVAAQDNHRANWGIQDSARLAVFAPNLTQDSLLEAFRKRHFYATQNENLQLAVNVPLRDGTWAQMGDRLIASDVLMNSSGEGSEMKKTIPVKVRLADADAQQPLARFEVVVSGQVAGVMAFPPKKKVAETKKPFFAFLGPHMPPDFERPKNDAPWAGEFAFEIPLQGLEPGRFIYFYIRLMQGDRGEVFSQSSPISIDLSR